MITPVNNGNLLRCVVVVLELEAGPRNAERIYSEIKAFGNWWHCIGGVWIIRTSFTAKAIREKLRQRLEADDRLLVLELSGEATWSGFSGESAAWLKDNLIPRGESPHARRSAVAAGAAAGAPAASAAHHA